MRSAPLSPGPGLPVPAPSAAPRRHGRRRRVAAMAAMAAVLLAAAAGPASASAQAGAAPDTTALAPTNAAEPAAPVDAAEADAIARALNCPICEGRNLIDCPLDVCAEMRAEIRARLAAGDDRDAIIRHFVDYYGERVRNTPPLSGLSGLAWWVPLAALAVGVAVVGRLVGGRMAASGAASAAARAPAAPPGVDEGYAAALERLAAEREAEER